jgi:hypothetical protein
MWTRLHRKPVKALCLLASLLANTPVIPVRYQYDNQVILMRVYSLARALCELPAFFCFYFSSSLVVVVLHPNHHPSSLSLSPQSSLAVASLLLLLLTVMALGLHILWTDPPHPILFYFLLFAASGFFSPVRSSGLSGAEGAWDFSSDPILSGFLVHSFLGFSSGRVDWGERSWVDRS